MAARFWQDKEAFYHARKPGAICRVGAGPAEWLPGISVGVELNEDMRGAATISACAIVPHHGAPGFPQLRGLDGHEPGHGLTVAGQHNFFASLGATHKIGDLCFGIGD
jgi:hypothetical protein